MANKKLVALPLNRLVDRSSFANGHHRVLTTDKLRNGVVTLALLMLLLYVCAGKTSREQDSVSTDHRGEIPRLMASLPLKPIPSRLKPFQDCSVSSMLSTNLTFLESANPLQVSEFAHRRDRLAQALADDKLDAFVVEPGYTFSYYANISQRDWEVWEPEERPFLMVVQRSRGTDGLVCANTTFLVPSFEAERARLLGMPFEEQIAFVTYEEHWDPYTTLLNSHLFRAYGTDPKIMVDEEIRDFISRGLSAAGFSVTGLGGTPETIRQTKSEAEIGILRAVNTGTVEALRAMRKCMVTGLTENDVTQVLDNTLRASSLDPFFDIVLFDGDASNPHGGTNGSRALAKETMVLIDVGAHLYGYSSDICRSFFPPFFKQPRTSADFDNLSGEVKHKVDVWNIALDAQTASLGAMQENASAALVDLAARSVIEKAGYGESFTHRVGHGIGIKAHESPYLHKGNVDTKLKAGMTFTSEPGIYLVDEFGVRHEDVLLVRAASMPELLTGSRARDPWTP